jgi:hypothetical protein
MTGATGDALDIYKAAIMMKASDYGLNHDLISQFSESKSPVTEKQFWD